MYHGIWPRYYCQRIFIELCKKEYSKFSSVKQTRYKLFFTTDPVLFDIFYIYLSTDQYIGWLNHIRSYKAFQRDQVMNFRCFLKPGYFYLHSRHGYFKPIPLNGKFIKLLQITSAITNTKNRPL
jgi:hypothetical protein